MYIESVPNRNSPPAILLRESYREHGKVRKRTLCNLSDWPTAHVEGLRGVLKGGSRRPGAMPSPSSARCRTAMSPWSSAPRETSASTAPRTHTRRAFARDLVLAMIATGSLIPPRNSPPRGHSRLKPPPPAWARSRSGRGQRERTLHRARLAGRTSACHRDGARQTAPEEWHAGALRRLLQLHGRTLLPPGPPRLQPGRKKGKLQIVYGLLCAPDGCPVAIEVFDGNTGDPTTLAAQVRKLKQRFGLDHVVLVGDRGMITQARLTEDIKTAGLDWITALRAPAIKELVKGGALQLSLFDERDMASITSPDFPGERLIVCRNPDLAASAPQAPGSAGGHRTRSRAQPAPRASAIRCAAPAESGWPSAP